MKLIKKASIAILICVLLFTGIVGCAKSDPIVGAWVSSYNSESYLYFNKDGSIGDEIDKAETVQWHGLKKVTVIICWVLWMAKRLKDLK